MATSGKPSDKESQMSIHKECVDFNTLNDNVVMQFYIYLCVCVYTIYKYTLIHTDAYTYMRKSKRKEIERKEEEPERKTAK